LRMLQQTCEAVRVGGFLVYSTCSSEPEENEDVLSAFLAARPDFSLAVPPLLDGTAAAAVLDPQGCLRTYPHVHGLEAFFAALMVRRR